MGVVQTSLVMLAGFMFFLGLPARAQGDGAVPRDMQEIVTKKIFATSGQWTRSGSLGTVPIRITEGLPLSDQGNDEGWKTLEAFSDEFDGDTLDDGKWWPNDPKWKGRQPGYFDADNVVIGDGKANLWMKLGDVPEEAVPEGYTKYTTSFLKGKDPVKYGYFEVKAKTGSTSSAFWFYNGTPEIWTEIDVFEIAGATPKLGRQYNMNAHVFVAPGVTEHFAVGGVWNAPWQLGADYHTYGLAWDADLLRYYVDGVLVRAMRNTHWHHELHLCFDSETMPEWFGIPEDRIFPTVFNIEYVRAWTK